MAVPDEAPGSLPEFIEKFAAVLIIAGFPPMPARVFVALLVTDSGRLTAAELVDLLQISPRAVSGRGALPDRARPLVHKERVPGRGGSTTGCPATSGTRSCCSANHVLTRGPRCSRRAWAWSARTRRPGGGMAGHAAFFEFLAAEMPAVMARWDALGQAD